MNFRFVLQPLIAAIFAIVSGMRDARPGRKPYIWAKLTESAQRVPLLKDALSPGFPPVVIDGEYFWDGGIMTNTPLQYVREDMRISALVVAVDVFSGEGELPKNLSQAQERAKDIQYQNKQRLTIARIREIEDLSSTVADVLAKLPEELRSDPQVQKLVKLSTRGPLTVIHLVNRHNTESSDFKGYEFSRAAVTDLRQGGRQEVETVLRRPETSRSTEFANGVRLLEA